MEDRITLGKIIKERREKLGMSQRDLAEKMHMNNATVSRLEGRPDIVSDPKTLKQVSTILDIDYNYLLSLNGSIDDEPEIRLISRASKKMSARDKKKMIEALKNIFNDAFTDVDSDLPQDK